MTATLGPDLELQFAIVTVLNASADIKALIGSTPLINPVQGTTWPGSYIEIGEGQNVPDLAECVDGSEVYLTIHIWSRADRSFSDVKKIAATIWAVLKSATITLTENRLLLLEEGQQIDRDGLQCLRDPDGVTMHGILTLRALTEPAA